MHESGDFFSRTGWGCENPEYPYSIAHIQGYTVSLLRSPKTYSRYLEKIRPSGQAGLRGHFCRFVLKKVPQYSTACINLSTLWRYIARYRQIVPDGRVYLGSEQKSKIYEKSENNKMILIRQF